MIALLAQVVLVGLSYHIGGWEHRFANDNGPENVIVGRYYWERMRIAGACSSVEVKRYPRERIVVHICYT